MSTQTATAPVATLDARPRPGVPMSRLVRVELRKMVDTRAGLWLMVAIGVVTVAIMSLFMAKGEVPDLTLRGFIGVALTPQGFLLPILGILLITSEWGQRTALVTFTLEPNRSKVVAAKTAAALTIGLLAVAVLASTAVLATEVAAALRDGPGTQDLGWVAVGSVLVLQVSNILQGLAFGMLLRNSAAAIVSYFALPLAFSALFTFVASLRDVAPWIDLATSQQRLFDLGTAMTGEQWAQLGVTSALWIALPLVVGFLVLLRSEVKSS